MHKLKGWRHMDLLIVILYLVIQHTGINIAEDVCSTAEVTATADLRFLFSPNFPNQYPTSLDCITSITSPRNTVIELEFHTFQLEKSEGCAKDFLKITDKAGNILLHPSCGARLVWPRYPYKIVTIKNDMTITFTTDDRISHQGFNVSWRAVNPSPQLLVMAENSSIQGVYRFNNKIVFTKSSNIKDPLAVDYDSRTRYIFYSDRGTKSIGKFHAERVSFENILFSENISEPFGLRIDVVSRLLYWTDADLGTISVSNLDGGYRHILLDTGLEKPGAIVTEPYQGYIYFTDWGNEPKIERADGDGKNRLVLVRSEITSPRSLAIDLKERALYWIDSFERRLHRVNYDGTGSTVLEFLSQLNICSLVLDAEAFFWSGYKSDDELTGYVYAIDRKLERDQLGVRWGQDKQYSGLSLRPYQESGDILPGTCPTTECSGLCLPKPNGVYKCLTEDVTPPIFKNCPEDISTFVAPGKSSTVVPWDEILLQDDNDFIVSSSHMSGSEFSLGSEIVSIAAKDVAGNKAWCNFSITVDGHTQTTHNSLLLYLVISIGGALIVLACLAVTIQIVYVCKVARQNKRHNRNQAFDDNAPISHDYSGHLLVSGGSVQFTKQYNEPHFSQCLDAY